MNIRFFRILALSIMFFLPAAAENYGAKFKLSENFTEQSVTILRLYDYEWISVNSFLGYFGSDISMDENDWVLKGRLQEKSLKIAGGSAFFRINEILYHLPTSVERVGNELFIPKAEFLKILQTHFYPDIRYREVEDIYILGGSPYTISDLDVREFKNGSMVRISTNKDYSKKNCSLWEGSGGWLYFTIYDATCDTMALKREFQASTIKYVVPIQLENAVQLSFKLRNSITGSEFYMEKDPSGIVINLRKPLTNDLKEELIETRNKWLIDTIVLDAGHGGKDPGAPGYDGTREKDIVLDVVLRLGALLEKNLGVSVVYTRKTDTFIPLQQRTSIANKSGGKLFISVHCNWAESRSASGSETYLLSLERNSDAVAVAELENKVIQFEDNQEFYDKLTSEQRIIASLAQNTYMKESEDLAGIIESNFKRNLHDSYAGSSRGVKQAGFYVLVGASMPSVLTEIGFMTNRNDLRNLKKSSYRQKVAESLYYAVRDFKAAHEKEVKN